MKRKRKKINRIVNKNWSIAFAHYLKCHWLDDEITILCIADTHVVECARLFHFGGVERTGHCREQTLPRTPRDCFTSDFSIEWKRLDEERIFENVSTDSSASHEESLRTKNGTWDEWMDLFRFFFFFFKLNYSLFLFWNKTNSSIIFFNFLFIETV